MSWFRETLDAADLSHVFLDGTLALLLFAGSLHVDLTGLSRRRWMILALATASVVLSTLIFGAGMWAIFALVDAAVPLAWCFVLGAILAPTGWRWGGAVPHSVEGYSGGDDLDRTRADTCRADA
jgi:NhaP-type Na+/H+ or K+/H+ antiporter